MQPGGLAGCPRAFFLCILLPSSHADTGVTGAPVFVQMLLFVLSGAVEPNPTKGSGKTSIFNTTDIDRVNS